MPFLSHGGNSLRYERAGAGLPMLFLHGLMGNHTFWDRQLDLRKYVQVLRMDLRGHGDSSKPRGSYAIATLATDVEHLVGALGLQRCVLVGWSMGGLVALESVRLLGDKVAGLVLVGTTPCPVAADGKPPGFTAAEQQEHLTAVDADYKTFARDLAGRLFHTEQTGLAQWVTQQLLRTPSYVAKAALEDLFTADCRDMLGSLAIPTLVCHGRHDGIFPFSAAEYAHGAIRGSELLAFDNSGHAPMIEETPRFNEALVSFADRVLGKAPAARPAAPTSAAAAATARADDRAQTSTGPAPKARRATPTPARSAPKAAAFSKGSAGAKRAKPPAKSVAKSPPTSRSPKKP
jgi:pimeloyl-ACP methyl ester carboxylesterase